MRQPIRVGRTKSKRGNAMLEVGLSLMPLLALMLGIIDLSMPMFLKSTFTNAVRDAVRYGVVYPNTGGQSMTTVLKQRVQQSALGFLDGPTGLSKIQVKYYSPAGFGELTGAGANAGGNILEVSIVGYQWNWVAPVWRSTAPITINAVSQDRLEVLPAGSVLPAP